MRLQEVGECTPKANAASPNGAFTKRSSAAISELEPLAEVDGEGEAASEDPDAPDKGARQLSLLRSSGFPPPGYMPGTILPWNSPEDDPGPLSLLAWCSGGEEGQGRGGGAS